MSASGRLARTTVVYLIGNFGSKVLSFLLIPIYSFFILPEQMGTYDLLIVTVSLLQPVVMFQIGDGVFRWLLGLREAPEIEGKKVLWNGFVLMLAGLVVGIGGVSFSRFSAGLGFGDVPFILLLTVSCFQLFFQQSARGLGRDVEYAVSGVLYSLAMFCACFVILFAFGLGVQSLIYGQVVGSVASVLFLLIRVSPLREFYFSPFDKKLCMELLGYSAPLIPNSICWWVVNASNRYIVTFVLGASANGIFSMAAKFPNIIQVFTSIFNLAWQESAILEYAKEKKELFYSKVFNVYATALFSVSLLLIPLTRIVIKYFLGEAYQDCWHFVPLLYLGMVFSALAAFLGALYQSSRETKGNFYTTIFAGIINVAANMLLIRFFGLQGAAVSTLIAFSLLFAIRVIDTKKYARIRIHWKTFSVMLSLSVAFALLCMQDAELANWACLVAGIVIAATMNKTLFIWLVSQIKRRRSE